MFEVMYLASGSIHKNSGNRINFTAFFETAQPLFFSSLLCSIVNAHWGLGSLVTWEFVELWSGCGPLQKQLGDNALKSRGMNYSTWRDNIDSLDTNN